MKTLTEQIASVEREIAMRKHVYPRWVEDGRYTQQKADHEIECMESVLRTLRAVKRVLPACTDFAEKGEPGNEVFSMLGEAFGEQQGEMF